MKKIILLYLFIISPAVFASGIVWTHLELFKDYKLIQDISFDDGALIKAGEIFKLQDTSDSIDSNYYEFKATRCSSPDKKSDKSVFEVTENPDQPVYVIATLRKYCNIELEINRRDTKTISPFAK